MRSIRVQSRLALSRCYGASLVPWRLSWCFGAFSVHWRFLGALALSRCLGAFLVPWRFYSASALSRCIGAFSVLWRLSSALAPFRCLDSLGMRNLTCIIHHFLPFFSQFAAISSHFIDKKNRKNRSDQMIFHVIPMNFSLKKFGKLARKV